eukprot:11176139-Lingulodinium_polyedra.AAC.1
MAIVEGSKDAVKQAEELAKKAARTDDLLDDRLEPEGFRQNRGKQEVLLKLRGARVAEAVQK